MTRWHFHAANGVQYRDEAGDELPGLEEAKAMALRAASGGRRRAGLNGD